VKQVVVLAAILMVQACINMNAWTLKVEHDTAVNITGPISEAGGIAFQAPQLEDVRLDKSRIGGWTLNPGDGADITSKQPVDVIVENAITDALKDNGYSVVEDGKVRITGTVEHFWFEHQATGEDQGPIRDYKFTGDVQCTLNFIDAASNTSIYTSSYSGNFKKKILLTGPTEYTEVMNKAIDKLIEDMVFDEDLKDALAGYKQ
jgi:uncharacterized lipoprotein YajG